MSEIHQQTHSLQAALTEQTKSYLNEMKVEDITDLYNKVLGKSDIEAGLELFK